MQSKSTSTTRYWRSWRRIPPRFRIPITIFLVGGSVGLGLFYAFPTRAVPGDFAVYRETTAQETITTTPTKLDFSTVVSEGTGFSIDGTYQHVELAEAGHYLALYSLSMETISGTNRSEIQGQLDLDGWDMPYGLATCYFPRSQGIDECWMSGAAIVVSTSSNQQLAVKAYKTDSNSAGVRRRSNESGFMLVRLDDDWEYARIRETAGGQAFNTYTWTTVSWDTEDELDSIYTRNDGDITLTEAGHYLVTYNILFRNNGLSIRRNNEARLTLNGYELPGSRTTAYTVSSNSALDHSASFVGIIEATTTNQVLRLQGVCESEGCGGVTAVGGMMGITIAKLPHTAEYVRLGYSADDQLIDGTNVPFNWDTQGELDAPSFSHSTSSNPSRVNINQNGDYLFLSSFYTDRTSTANTNRQQPRWKWRTNGTSITPYGSFAQYNRGELSADGAWSAGASGGVVYPSLTSSDYVEILATNESTGLDSLGFYDGPRLGLQGVRLASLVSPDVVVSSLGTQLATSSVPNTDFYVGGAFLFDVGKSTTETITSITITEMGTVDAQTGLDAVRLYYEYDTVSPHNCAGETYDGTELQFGATTTVSSANGTATFSDSVSISTSTPMCVYVVTDVTELARDAETIAFEIANPSTDITITSGSIGPEYSVALSGSTTLIDDELTQVHYHWRLDDGSEALASSATGGVEDALLIPIKLEENRRLRFGVSNEGSIPSEPVSYRLEYAEEITTCSAIETWTDVSDAGGAWDMYDSPNLTDGEHTTNIALALGGVTDENTTFLTPNGGVKDTSSQTSAITLAEDEFVELEYSITSTLNASEGKTYCFRVSDAGTPLANYDVYAQATIAADVQVSTLGAQVEYTDSAVSDVYLGGVFVFTEQNASRTIESITISETGTIDALADLSSVRLYYEHDTSDPYDCVSESYTGGEAQYGATSTFNGANGSILFTDSVLVSTTSALCVYTVLDVEPTAPNGSTLDVEITSPDTDVVVTNSGTVNPTTPVLLTGSTTIRKAQLEQLHFHWRNNDGTEAGASSATGGNEDTPITQVAEGDTHRLRVLVSNEGSTSTPSTIFSLEYGKKTSTCDAVSWESIADVGGAWAMSDTATLTDGADTTNISVATGGVTDENTTFLTPNGGVRDVSASTSPLTLSETQFVELEYAIEATSLADFSDTYCFRVVANNEPLFMYGEYPQATIRQNQDFNIQRGELLISGTSGTITAGVDYVSPGASTSAFIRITNTQHTGAGRNSLGGSQNADAVTVFISNPSNIKDSITFVRAGTNSNSYVAWEIVEYTGPVGGDNEIVVHAGETLTIPSGDSTISKNISGITNDEDVTVFVTGVGIPDTGVLEYNTALVTADWDGVLDEVVLERNDTGVSPTVSYAVVEFTGSNWRVQRVEHTYTTAGVWESEGIQTVNDISRAFLHVQKRSSSPGMDEFGHEIYLYGAATLRFQIEGGASTPSGQTSVAWVIENIQTNGFPMKVHRSNGTQSGGPEPSAVSVGIGTSTRSLTTTSVFTNNRTSGTGTVYPQPIMGVLLTSTSTYKLWLSDTGGTRTYRTEVLEWPTAVRTIKQNYYRFYVDNDALTPTDPWPAGGTDVGENTAITGLDAPPNDGDVLRLRMSLAVSGASISQENTQFKLQYGARDTSCTAITSWLDIGDSASTTALWRGYNATPLNGTPLSDNPPIPGDLVLSVSDRAGTFEESNPTANNPYKVFMGEDVEYDWILQANGVVDFTSYCFRMTKADGGELEEYVYYPTVAIAGFQVEQKDWRFYDDETSLTPSVALADTNVAPSNVPYSGVFKLRVLLEELAGRDGVNTKYKLQWSEFSDFSVAYDMDDIDTCTLGSRWCYADGAGTESATITEKVLLNSDACTGGVGDGCGTHNEYSYVPDVVGEVGTTTADSAGTTVTLAHAYTDPVFIVEAISGDTGGGSTNRPAAAIITATTTSSFTVRIQEPDNESDTHGEEMLAYIVMERGAYLLPDGRKVDVNSIDTNHYYGNAVAGTSDDTCAFTQTFASTPVILTSLQTNNNTGAPDFLTASIALANANDFACSIEVPDGETNVPTNSETIGWIAVEGGVFTNNGIALEATSTTLSITGWDDTPWYENTFTQVFSTIPGIVASKLTRNGGEGGWVRYGQVSSNSVYLAIDERDDGERTHTNEVVSYLALSDGGVLYRGGPSDFVFKGNTKKEFEFTLKHHDARSNVTYFFRLYDVHRDTAVIASTTTTSYPSLSTEGATLSFSVQGVAEGVSTEGVVTDVTTSATSVSFGSLILGEPKNAAHRLTVSTNASEGYQVLAYERQDLISGAGATIEDISGSNEAPVAWDAGCSIGAKSCYGYHAGDNTLAGNSNRFLLNDTYAPLTGTPAEIAYSSGPVTSESTDIIYRVWVGVGQPAGKYESKIVYIVLPVF